MLKNSKNKLNEEKKVQKREIDDLRRKVGSSALYLLLVISGQHYFSNHPKILFRGTDNCM